MIATSDGEARVLRDRLGDVPVTVVPKIHAMTAKVPPFDPRFFVGSLALELARARRVTWLGQTRRALGG